MQKLRLALIGAGYLNEIVANAVKEGLLPEYELVAVFERDLERREAFVAKFGGKACDSIAELLAERPDYTAEAASVNAVREHAQTILEGGSHLVLLSIGALADADFYDKIKAVGKANNRKIYLPCGAVGGFDVLRTASLMDEAKVSITALTSPRAISHTSLTFDGILDVTEPTEVFRGTTKEAIERLPARVNVAIATALASVGPENTEMDIHILPGFQGDEYHVRLDSPEVKTEMKLYSRTAAVAGWSVVAALQNIVSPIEIF